jgi:hypothetical protein
MSVEEDKETALVYKNRLDTEIIPQYKSFSTNATAGYELSVEYSNQKLDDIIRALGHVATALQNMRLSIMGDKIETESLSQNVTASNTNLNAERSAVEELFKSSVNEGATIANESMTGATDFSVNAAMGLIHARQALTRTIETILQAERDIKTATARAEEVRSPLQQAAEAYAIATTNLDETGNYLKAASDGLETYVRTG